MGINFPATPTVGQVYPSPAVAGLPQYKWDGEKWTIPNTSVPGKQPIYSDGSIAMTAALTLVTPPVGDNSTKAASTAFVNYDSIIATGVDLNTITKSGTYATQSTQPNSPPIADQYYLHVQTYLGNTDFVLQRAVTLFTQPTTEFIRIKFNGTWYPWKQAMLDTNVVRYDAVQALTTAQRTQARQNVYAAPLDALAFNGIQINGGMEINQQALGTVNVHNTTVVDNWVLLASASGQAAATPIAAAFFPNLPNFVQIATAVAQTIAAGTIFALEQRIEGNRMSRLGWGTANAQPLTVGFWTAHNRTGTYSVSIRNPAGTRTYSTTYTQNAATTQEYKTVTIPGCTDGVWPTDNSMGALIEFAVAMGSTYTNTSANAWTNGNYMAAPGQINGMAATSDIFRIGGIVLIPGSDAPISSRASLVLRPADQELILCKRYWQKVGGAFNNDIFIDGYCGAGQALTQTLALPVEMRANPIFTLVGAWTYNNVTGTVTNNGVGARSIVIYVTATATGQTYAYNPNTGCYITLDARF